MKLTELLVTLAMVPLGVGGGTPRTYRSKHVRCLLFLSFFHAGDIYYEYDSIIICPDYSIAYYQLIDRMLYLFFFFLSQVCCL